MQKLLEYKQFKAAAEQLSAQQEWMQQVYVKPQEDLSEYRKEPDEILNMDLAQFVKTFQLFLMKKQRLEEVRKTYARVERQRVTIENRIEQLKACFLHKSQLTFRELLQGAVSRYDVVITFMSLLELLKQHVVTAVQETRYGEITVALASPAQAGLTEEIKEGAQEGRMQRSDGQRGEYERERDN